MIGVHRDDRVHQHADVLAVAHRAEAPLAGGMPGEIQLRRVHHRQRMPSGSTLTGQLTGVGQHLAAADRLVVEEVAEPTGLIPALAQHVQAHGLVLLHRAQQVIAGRGQALVAKSPELRLCHANRSPTLVRGGRERLVSLATARFLPVPDLIEAKKARQAAQPQMRLGGTARPV